MRRIADAALFLIVLCGMTACGHGGAAGPGGPGGPGGPPHMPPMPVEAVTLKAQPLAAGVQTVGSLRAQESVVVRPEVAGRISRIHFAEGGRVAEGEPLFTLDDSLGQASLNEAIANLDNSRRAAERAQQMVAQKLISQSDYDKARAQFGVDQARAATARTMVAKMTLRAPFSGEVGLREVSVGDYVNVGQDLVKLVRLDPIEVDFSAPDSAVAELHQGQTIHLTVDAFPTETFSGKVVAIDPVIDPSSRSAKLRAQLPNPNGRLKPGQFARLQLETGGGNVDAVLVPEQALMQDGDMRYVYTIIAGKAKRVEIKTGVRVPGFLQVVSGLKAGDVVITAGQTKPIMHEGLDVKPLPTEAPAATTAGSPPKQ
jgi:membrane fusion protein (multidrug efflux system)